MFFFLLSFFFFFKTCEGDFHLHRLTTKPVCPQQRSAGVAYPLKLIKVHSRFSEFETWHPLSALFSLLYKKDISVIPSASWPFSVKNSENSLKGAVLLFLGGHPYYAKFTLSVLFSITIICASRLSVSSPEMTKRWSFTSFTAFYDVTKGTDTLLMPSPG